MTAGGGCIGVFYALEVGGWIKGGCSKVALNGGPDHDQNVISRK